MTRAPGMVAAGRRKTRGSARRGHAGDRLNRCGQLFLEGGASRGIVADGRKVHVEGEDALDAESEVHLLQTVEARQQHAGADQQRQRERELRGGERRCGAVPARACRWRSAIADAAHWLGAMRARRSAGATPKATAVASVTSAANPSTVGIEPDIVEPRDGVAAEAPQNARRRTRPARAPAARRARRAAGFRPAVGGRAGDGRSPAPQRIANSWTRPGRAHEHEVGHVHARDQEHESHGDEQQLQRAARRSPPDPPAAAARRWRSARAAGQRSSIDRLSAASSARACSS